MFLALGASTLLNTTVNILTPAVFCYAGLMVNVLFIQGIGTSGSQFCWEDMPFTMRAGNGRTAFFQESPVW